MPDELETEIASGDRRRSLVALRAYLAHELAVHRCSKCQASQLRTGDTAAIVLRLAKVMEEIEALPQLTGEVSKLDELRAKRAARSTDTPDSSRPLGTKSAERRQGGRRTSSPRRPTP